MSCVPADDRRKRVAEVVPQHRDELFTKLGFGPLRREREIAAQQVGCRFRDALFKRRGQHFQFVARFQQFTLVSASVGRVKYGQANEPGLALGILSLRRVDEHREALAILLDEVERDFVEESLHPQQRREMGLIEDAARDVEEVMQPPAD